MLFCVILFYLSQNPLLAILAVKKCILRNYCIIQLKRMQITSNSAELLKDILKRADFDQLTNEDIEVMKDRMKHTSEIS